MRNSQTITYKHNYSFDFVRTATMLAVILFHAAGAYGLMSVQYWPVSDSTNLLGSGIRDLFDVFIMPVFFFIAGYFVLPSLKNKTLPGFVKNKFRRLYVYWIFFVLIFIPTGGYFIQNKQGSVSYLDYWLHMLLIFKQVSIGLLVRGKYGHMHMWFVSLLFYVFIIFAVCYRLSRFFSRKDGISQNQSSARFTVYHIIVFGLIVTFFYYAGALFFPGSSWLVVPMFLQFKVTHLPVLLLFFSFGVFCYSRGWFTGDDIPLSIGVWSFISLVLTVVFFAAGNDYFVNIDTSNTLNPLYLFLFSIIRTFLIISYLMLLLKVAVIYFKEKNALINRVALVSFEVYIVHLFVVTTLQSTLLNFAMVPVSVKIISVFISGTIISYFLGKYTLYKFPRISAGVFVLGFAGMVLLFWQVV